MDSVGVDAAIVNPLDARWLMKAMSQYPDRIAGVFHLHNVEEPDVEEQVLQLRDIPGAL
jgi:hypothetical protein